MKDFEWQPAAGWSTSSSSETRNSIESGRDSIQRHSYQSETNLQDQASDDPQCVRSMVLLVVWIASRGFERATRNQFGQPFGIAE